MEGILAIVLGGGKRNLFLEQMRGGGGSIHQPIAYTMRGGRGRKTTTGGKTRRRARTQKRRKPQLRGGFIPSAMGNLLTTGPLFLTAAVSQGMRLLRNNKERMMARGRLTRRHRKM